MKPPNKPKAEPLLWNRGHSALQNWYLRLPIPKPHRQHAAFGGKLSVVRPLDTGDLAVARRRRDVFVVRYRHIFDRLSAGEEMTPEQIKTAVELDLEAIAEFSQTRTLQRESRFFRMLAAMFSEENLPSMTDQAAIGKKPDLIEKIAKKLNIPLPMNPDVEKQVWRELWKGNKDAFEKLAQTIDAPSTVEPTETISQAGEAWFTEKQRDASTATKQTTIEGHRQRLRVFIDRCGDLPLTSITRAMASDFLSQIGKTNRTTNNYGTTLACVFRSAKDRGRFSGDNPFERHRRKVSKKTARVPFEVDELQTLFDALPRTVKPTKHSPEIALPWVTLIAAFTGMRLEEISQLKAADIRVVSTNGGTTTVIDIHNGTGNQLKNESAVRLVPVHSALVNAGLLDYVKALPEGSMLFPGLKRRTSKGDKIGARVGEIFGKRLKAINLKREGLCFHSLRHTVARRLDGAGVRKTDVARILGHAVEGESFGTYSDGPGLKVLAGVIETIRYPGLTISTAL